ncbi:MAG: hypothetical protein ACN4G0_00140 [Polyangiales bacterium]
MTRALVLCASLVLALACKPRDEPSAPPAPSAVAEPASPDNAEPPALRTGSATDPIVEKPADPVAEKPADPVAAEPAKLLEPEPTPAPPPRDLAAELRAAVRSPADCLRDYQPASAKLIRVEIRAVVRPTGMVIEPSASGGGLSANDLRCLEQRAGDVVLSPLTDTVSAHVSTFVDIQYEPPTVEEYDVGGALPKRKNVVPSLPKKEPIAPSGKPLEGPEADPIDGPSGVPIEGPRGVPIEGPQAKPIGDD